MFEGNTRRALRTALLIGVGSFAVAPALAQTQGPVETVVVTGTLLHRTDTETPSPVTFVSKEDIVRSGLTTTADVVRSISADNSGTIPTAFGNGFAAGSSGVALRGLTVNSTLVLINSRRTSNYPLADDGERGFVDLNTIPLDDVDHIEVLKDGASSLYGTDAIAGVVNIILRDNFQGATGEVEGGTSEHGGGNMLRMTGTVGYGDLATNKFNAHINLEYERDDFIRVGQRDFPFNNNDLSPIGGFDFNSPTSVYGSVAPGHLTDPNDPTTGVQDEGALLQILRPGGCGPIAKKTTDDSGTYCEQNIAPYGDDQPKDERYGGYARISVQPNGDTEAWLDASYFENKVWVHGTPSNIRTTTPHITSNIALPAYLTSGARNPNDPFAANCPATGVEGVTPCEDAMIHYRFGDIPGFSQYDTHVIRTTGGIKGTWDGFTYDTAFVVAHSSLDSELDGFLDFNQLLSDVRDGSYNFIDPSQNSGAVRAALAPPLTKTSTTDMDSFDVRASHDLFDLPGGAAALGFGFEVRHEETKDPDLNPGLNALGLGLAHTIGNRNIYSGFAELGMPVFKTLEVNVSGRYDHYSDFGDTFNPKVGAKWTPIPEIALRGTYSTGFRAPSFSENGSSEAEGFITFNPQSFYPAWAALHGNDEYTQPYGLGLLTTANPNIQPETSTNYTVGTILQPFTEPNITATVDYYHIEKKKVISPADPFPALDAAFLGGSIPPGDTVIFDNPDPQHPDAPLRPVVVGAPYINAASLVTDGIDMEVNGIFDVGYGITWNTLFSGTYIFTFDFTPSKGSPTQHWVGTQSPYILSSGAGTPQARGTWSNTLTYEDWTLSGTLYYTKGIKEATVDATGDSSCDFYSTAKKFCHMNAFWDFDLTARYRIDENVELFGTVRNLFDTKPPLDVIDYAGVNYNPTYAQQGIVGRFFALGVSVKTGAL